MISPIILVLMLGYSCVCALPKQRSWTGPTNFVEGFPPEPRYGHGIALLNQRLFVFGGFLFRTGLTQSFYEFDTKFLAWTNLSTLNSPIPSSRAFFGMTTSTDSIYLFGGNGLMNSMLPTHVM
jgi:hypothetical protein